MQSSKTIDGFCFDILVGLDMRDAALAPLRAVIVQYDRLKTTSEILRKKNQNMEDILKYMKEKDENNVVK